MKKLLQLFLTMILCVSMVACSNKMSAEETVTQMLDSYKEQKWEETTKYFSSSKVFDSVTSIVDESVDGYEEKANLLMDKLCDIDYKIIDVKEDGDKATVTVEIKATDVGTQFMKGMKDAVSLGMSLSLSSNTNQLDIAKQMMDKMFEPLKDCTKSVEATVKVNLVKSGGKWVISADNTELLNTILGGMLNMTSQFLDF